MLTPPGQMVFIVIPVSAKLSEIDLENGLLANSIIDSYGFVELIIFIEEKINIKLDENEINDVNFASSSQ